MRPSAVACRSGGHRRGDLWTSGRRTTLHSPELYDQMIVAQTAEEKRIRSEGNVPSEQAKIKSAARAYREHYRASVEHLGIDAQTVGSPDGPKLTSRPSYLGPTILSGYAGESATTRELDVGFGIRKDQFVYYDDDGRRIQHPTSAQMFIDAGLATASEINETFSREHQLSLDSKPAENDLLNGGTPEIGGHQQQRAHLLDDNAKVDEGGGDNVSLRSEVGSSHPSAQNGELASRPPPVGAISADQRRQPSAEVATLTKVKDKRDLLYNQKLRSVWDSALEDPVRGSGFKGPKRNVDNGSVVTKGTERTVYREMRCAGAATPLKGEEGYYEVADSVSDTGARMYGGVLRPSTSVGGALDQDQTSPNATNVFGLGEEQFRLAMLGSKASGLGGDGGNSDTHMREEHTPVEPLSVKDAFTNNEQQREDGLSSSSSSSHHPLRHGTENGATSTTTDITVPIGVQGLRSSRGGVGVSHGGEEVFKTSAEKDVKYASQSVDVNNPRVGPEFFKGADIAMDADLRKALDIKMRMAKEGKPSEPLSKILADEELKDGNDRFGAVSEARLNERVEEILNEKSAARRKSSRSYADVQGGKEERLPTEDDANTPRSTPKLNLAAPKGTRRAKTNTEPDASAAGADGPKKSLLGRLWEFGSNSFNNGKQAEQMTTEEILEHKRLLDEERERMIRSGEAFEDTAATDDAKFNARLGLRKTRATPSNSPVGRRKPLTYDSAKEISAEKLMMQIMGAGIELNTTTGDSRELFSGGFDFWGNRRRGANSYTEAANAGGRFANRLTPNYFNNDSLHAGMQASSLHHRTSASGGGGGDSSSSESSGGLGPSAVRNRAFTTFQKQSREDPYGAARNIGVGAGGLSAISSSQSSGGAGVGSSYSHSTEGEKAVKQFTFRQVLKQLDHSRMQPTNHEDMFGDSLKYLEAYIDMSNMVNSAEGAASSINVTGEESVADDILLPRAALKGRMVGLLFYTESQRSKTFMTRLETFAQAFRGDFVVLGLSYGAYERRDLLKRHRFCCVPTTMGARYVARDAGFIASWWHPYPSLFIVDGSTGKVITKYGYAAVCRRPETCFEDWMRGGEGITPLDVVLSRFDLLPSSIYTDRDRMTQRVVEDFKLEQKK